MEGPGGISAMTKDTTRTARPQALRLALAAGLVLAGALQMTGASGIALAGQQYYPPQPPQTTPPPPPPRPDVRAHAPGFAQPVRPVAPPKVEARAGE